VRRLRRARIVALLVDFVHRLFEQPADGVGVFGDVAAGAEAGCVLVGGGEEAAQGDAVVEGGAGLGVAGNVRAPGADLVEGDVAEGKVDAEGAGESRAYREG